MSSDIISCLQLDKNISNRIVAIKEVNGCDSSFIVSCVLSHCIKSKIPVIIIATHNSMNHYQHVGLKMNYNLQRAIDSGLIIFYNLGDEYVTNLISGNENISLQTSFEKIREKVLLMQTKHGSVNIIMEGVSHLFDLQNTLKEVNEFCHKIFSLLKDSQSFLLCHCNEANEEDITNTMSNLLIHKAHTVLELETLPSGWSTDVSGHMTVKYPGQKFEKEHMSTLELKTNRYLFKLYDRGVKLLAPGNV